MMSSKISVGIIQRVLTDYRVPFFDLLAMRFPGGVSVAAGQARTDENIHEGVPTRAKFTRLKNTHLFRGAFYLCWQKGVIEWLEEFQPEILIMEANPRYLSSGKAKRWMHSRNHPVIGWGLGAREGGGLVADWRKRSLHQFDAMLTYSQEGKNSYIASGFSENKIIVAPNAVSPRPQGSPPARLPHFTNGKAEVIYVGRLQARKRVDLLLKACASLPETIQPRLTIVGDGPELNALQNLAILVYPQTVFARDQRGEFLSNLFRKADIFVLPGTGGLALQQAMGFALPAIAAEGDGTQADLVRPENGWLIEPGSLESLRDALNTALSDPDELRKKGLESFRIVKEEINLECMADGFESAIKLVTGGAHS